MSMKNFKNLRLALGMVAILSLLLAAGPAASAKDDDTIKVGILHSLSGTMAISETSLKDVVLMLIEEQNAKGGVLGKQLEAVVVDPASNWPLFAEKARELIAVHGCSSTPCSTRARSRRTTCSTPARPPTSRRFPPLNT
jgi:urea transport system substrate-binding protein